MTPLAQLDRRRLARARTGAILLDAVLVAYAAWCVQFLLVHHGLGAAYLARWPALLALAPVLALLWQARGGSLGQRGYRSRLVRMDAEASPATRDQRCFVALVGSVQAAAIALPVILTRASGTGLFIAGAVALGLLLLGLRDPQGRSIAERLAGVRTTLRPVPATTVAPPWQRRFNSWVVIVLLLLTFVVGWIVTEVAPGALFTGWGRARQMVTDLMSPDWSVTGLVVERIVQTVFFALMASTAALPVAFVLSFLGARNVVTGSGVGNLVYFVARFLMNLTRSVEPIIWAIIFALWVGSGPFAGMLALFVHSVAALSKLYSEAIESIDVGPVEALRATGAEPLHVIRYGIVPQVIPPFLSFTVYRWDINVRMATILGFVGGGGIGEVLMPLSQMGAWPKVGVIIVFITIVVWLMDIASSKARERLV